MKESIHEREYKKEIGNKLFWIFFNFLFSLCCSWLLWYNIFNPNYFLTGVWIGCLLFTFVLLYDSIIDMEKFERIK